MGWFGSSLLKGIGKALTSVVGNIPIVGDIASSLMSDYERNQLTKEQVGTTKDLMNYQNQLNISNWETQQDFNNFANDLTHMKEAGINPLDYRGSSSTPSIAGVSGGSPPDISSLLNYQASMKLLNKQLQTADLDIQRKQIDNEVARAEADVKIADAKADLKFGDRVIGPKPDDLHDWQIDKAGYWYYLDESGAKVYAPETEDLYTQRDILRDVRYKKELDEAETVRYNKYMAEYNQRIRTIEAVIAEQYGISMASEQLHQLTSNISSIEARTDLTNEQKFQLELDNEIWRKLGADNRAIVKVLQYILGFIR